MDDFNQRYAGILAPGAADAETLFVVGPPPPCPAVVPTIEAITVIGGPAAHGMQQSLGPLPPAAHIEVAVAPPAPPVPTQSQSTAATGSAENLDRAAIAREKNRLAQRRFREKERKRLAEVQHRADGLEAQVAALKLENAELTHWQALMEKTLTVRNAMLSLVHKLETDGAAGADAAAAGQNAAAALQADAGLQAAGRELMAAVQDMPTLEQVEAMLPRSGAASSGDSTPSVGGPHGEPRGPLTAPPDAALGFAAALEGPNADEESRPQEQQGGAPPPLGDVVAAAASSAGGDAGTAAQLRAVGAPAPDKPSLRRSVEAMAGTDDLVVQWRDWRSRMAARYAAAQRGRFAEPAAMDALAAEMRFMVDLFWYAAQLQPRLFKSFVLRVLPPRGADLSPRLARIAEQSLEIMSESEIALCRQMWQRYTRRAAVAAVAARPWVRRLQELMQRPGAETLSDVAQRHLRAGEVASRLSHACQEQYTAAMAFLLEVSAQISVPVRCYWHLAAEEYLPDHPAIISEVLRLHQQRLIAQRQQQVAGGGGAPANGAARPNDLPAPVTA